jgi:hypothetical protein
MDDELSLTCETLSRQLDDARTADPLHALRATTAVQAVVEDQQQRAVRAAATVHSWTEIGAALGVSKQAAHQRFAKPWAEQLKGEIKGEAVALKTAWHALDPERVAAANAKRDAVIEEFKASRKANRKRR